MGINKSKLVSFLSEEYNLFGDFSLEGLPLAETIVDTINDEKGKGNAYIGHTYWDKRGGIVWSTILAYSDSLDTYFQLLYPSDKETIDKGVLDDSMKKDILSRVGI